MLRLTAPQIDESAIDAVAAVLRSGRLAHGAEANAFEEELAATLRCRDVVLCSSGTAALHLALMAAEIGSGDAVLVPDFSFPAAGNVVRLVGARPVLVDVDPRRYVITGATLAEAIARWSGAEKLRAVIPVHTFGCPVDMEAIAPLAREAGLVVIEGAADALGAQWQGRMLGSFGSMACFSMDAQRTLTTGEGGFVATASAALAGRLRRLRQHGMARAGAAMSFRELGLNYRLTDFQAALGRRQLPSLRGRIAQRRELARQYHEILSFLASEGVLTRPALDVPGHAWQSYMVVLEGRIDRGRVIRALAAQGVEAAPGAAALSELANFEDVRLPRSTASRLGRRGIVLPFSEHYGATEVETVAAALRRAIGGEELGDA
jgi:dTDP-4-amino-4,6-dideoxygalactose transaminase